MALPGPERGVVAGRRGRAAVAAGLAVAVAAVALWVGLAPPTPSGEVLGEQSTLVPAQAAASSAPEGAAESPSAAPMSPTAAGVRVETSSVPVWRDALGASHGEALFVLVNDGSEAVQVLPRESRFAVAGAGGEVAAGSLDAAVPPVLAPGERGYAFATFALPRPLPPDATASVQVAVGPPDPRLVELDVRRAALDGSGASLAVEGIARNPEAVRLVDGVIGAVLLSPSGEPRIALVDAASAGALEAHDRRTFRTAQPAIPMGDQLAGGDVVAVGWARREEP